MKLLGLRFIGFHSIDQVRYLTEEDTLPFVKLYKSPDNFIATMSFFRNEVFNGRLHGLVASF